MPSTKQPNTLKSVASAFNQWRTSGENRRRVPAAPQQLASPEFVSLPVDSAAEPFTTQTVDNTAQPMLTMTHARRTYPASGGGD